MEGLELADGNKIYLDESEKDRILVLADSLEEGLKNTAPMERRVASVTHAGSLEETFADELMKKSPLDEENGFQLLEDSIVNCKIVKFGDYSYFIHPLTDGVPFISRPLLLQAVKKLLPLVSGELDKIITAETMGVPLSVPLAVETGLPLALALKEARGDYDVVVDQKTGYSEANLYLKGIEEGEDVMIVDDVFSTGGTIKAVAEGVRKSGGNVVSAVVLVNKNKELDRFEEENGFPVVPVFNVEVKQGRLERF